MRKPGQWWCPHFGGLGPPFPICTECSIAAVGPEMSCSHCSAPMVVMEAKVPGVEFAGLYRATCSCQNDVFLEFLAARTGDVKVTAEWPAVSDSEFEPLRQWLEETM